MKWHKTLSQSFTYELVQMAQCNVERYFNFALMTIKASLVTCEFKNTDFNLSFVVLFHDG